KSSLGGVMTASRRRTQTQESRGGGSDGKMCSLPNGIRTAPGTSDVVASSRDQPHNRAHGTNAGTVTATHGLPAPIARNAWSVPVPSACVAAQRPKPLTKASRRRLPAAPDARRSAAREEPEQSVPGFLQGMSILSPQGGVVCYTIPNP